jgi:trehalose synthase-fused probable maltokinase
MEDALFTTEAGWRRLETEILPGWMRTQRWFGGKGREIVKCRVLKETPLGGAHLFAVDVEYEHGPKDLYCVPLALAVAPPIGVSAIAQVENGRVLFDAVYASAFREALFTLMVTRKSEGDLQGDRGELLGTLFPSSPPPPSRVLAAEQSNTSIIYGEKLFVKLYRRIVSGVNPDEEITRFLSEPPPFPYIPAFGGSVMWGDASLALALELRANDGNAWELALQHFQRFVGDRKALIEWEKLAFLLGKRTGQFHAALASPHAGRQLPPAFAAEVPFGTDADGDLNRHLMSETAALVNQAEELLEEISTSGKRPSGEAREALGLLSRKVQGQSRIRQAAAHELHRFLLEKQGVKPILRTRIHGDYHLGQVLFSRGDFVLIDFEGEPLRTLEERRAKQPPVRDVAGMLRSFHYAAYAARKAVELAEPWSRASQRAFLAGWRDAVSLLPIHDDRLLWFYSFEKVVYELRYEWNNRPDWLHIPLRGLLAFVNESGSETHTIPDAVKLLPP